MEEFIQNNNNKKQTKKQTNKKTPLPTQIPVTQITEIEHPDSRALLVSLHSLLDHAAPRTRLSCHLPLVGTLERALQHFSPRVTSVRE